MKTCSKCSVPKPESDFYARSNTGKLCSECKICTKKACRGYRENNKEQVLASQREFYKNNREQVLASQREYRANNKDQVLASQRKYRENNREQLLAGKREHYEDNREQLLAGKREYFENNKPKINQQRKLKYGSDPLYKLTCLLRGRVLAALAGKSKKSAKTAELLGAPWVWVEAYLEEQFQPGMSWENHGPVWHIDHIRPCASFDLTDPEQQRMCFHWSNLQPLFAEENLRKSDKYDFQAP